jgi:subtilisin family serine protease
MKNLWSIFAGAAICVFAAAAYSQKTVTQNNRFIEATGAVPNRYIVLFNENFTNLSTASDIESDARDLVAAYGGGVEKSFSKAVKGFSAVMSRENAIALSSDPRVKLVEADREISISDSQSNAPWNLDRVDQRSLPWDSMYNYASTGTGVHVYILDTGIRVTHSDFGGRASVAYDNIGDGQNGNDCNGHGTHVAGIVGGTRWGVAKGVYLHAVRVLPCSGSGLLSNVLAGVDWITANRIMPAVANISATVAGTSPSLESAISTSIASGVVYTIAAGNAASDACSYTPARTPDAITVGASDETDLRARYSNYGACIDIFAPGNLIDSDWNSSDTATNNLSGSSMASPMVAGVAALYLGGNPSASAASVAQAIRTAATQGVLTTNDPTSPNLLLYSRVGLVPTAATAAITGRVTNLSGIGVRNVSLSISSPVTGEVLFARTNLMGFYTFSSVPAGQTYILIALPNKRFEINDNIRTLSVTDNIAGINFVANTYGY